jgi:hypothetical protein
MLNEMEIALLWDKDTPFKQYLTDMGFDCEVILPSTLSAPFFSFTGYTLAIVPAGFGNEFYSGILLKVLRANSVLIKEFVNAGGTLFVSGALSTPDAYNWLPVNIEYVMERGRVRIEVVTVHEAAMLVEKEECVCDGYFEETGTEGEVIVTIREERGAKGKKAILVATEYGAGVIIATTIHEYPSKRFIAYCVGRR